MITSTIRISLNLDQNDACLILAFFRNFVKAGLTLSNIATYSAQWDFSYINMHRRAGTRTEPTDTQMRRDIIASRPRRDETLKLRDTRLHWPKITKYKNDSNTLEYGFY